MRHQCNGWSTSIPARRQYGAVSPDIYASPDVVFSQESKAKGWCLNPGCVQRLNDYNLKPPFLCHQCQKKWKRLYLILAISQGGIIGYPSNDPPANSQINMFLPKVYLI